MSRFLKTALGSLLISVIGGCSNLPNHSADYKNSTIAPSLELPPDLIGSSKIDEQLIVPEISKTATYSDYSNDKTRPLPVQPGIDVLPKSKQVQIKRDGRTRWLEMQGKPDSLWTKVKQFWLKNGFQLKIDNPQIGIMETDWAENRADIPQDGIRKWLGKVFDTVYSASTRDKFRVRLERGSVAGTTELYLTHQGAEEVAKGKDWEWQGRPSDPELEAEMINRLIVFFGVEKTQADTLLAENKIEPVSRAQLIDTQAGHKSLIVREDFEHTWRRTGLALDRVGFTVEDRDRTRGIYFIRYIDPDADKGFLGGLFGDNSTAPEEYIISLIDHSPTTHIVLKDNSNKIVQNKTAEKILMLLQEQLQ
ncbi:MAG: outer membrane protein assembly factor BamC [Candidatus Parabeggiatoa sp.]|nr:outer membrane protein assembly factor BamC [Candidatus Parabeggiatoa sp.]